MIRLARSGTHLHSIEPLRHMLAEVLPGQDSPTEAAVRLRRGQHRARQCPVVQQRPLLVGVIGCSPPFLPLLRLPPSPVIVLSRHAGPGDSLLLVRELLSVYQRRPRVVMKASMQLDPSLDVVANRVPNVFITPRRTGEQIFVEQIRRLASGLDRSGALVIFPEGGNWTPGRWRRGIRRLEQLGRPDLAGRAQQMPNLLPPRPAGRWPRSPPPRRPT